MKPVKRSVAIGFYSVLVAGLIVWTLAFYRVIEGSWPWA